jgi:hypothetical protein
MKDDFICEIIFKMLNGRRVKELMHHLQSMKHRWVDCTAYLVRFLRREKHLGSRTFQGAAWLDFVLQAIYETMQPGIRNRRFLCLLWRLLDFFLFWWYQRFWWLRNVSEWSSEYFICFITYVVYLYVSLEILGIFILKILWHNNGMF